MLTLVALAAPQFKNSFSNLEVKNAAFNLRKLLSFAHEKSILEKTIYKISLDFDRGTARLYRNISKNEYGRASGRYGKALEISPSVSWEGSAEDILFYPDGSCDEAVIGLFNKKGEGYQINLKAFGGRVELKEIAAEV